MKNTIAAALLIACPTLVMAETAPETTTKDVKSTGWSNVYMDAINEGLSTDSVNEKAMTGQIGFEGGYDYKNLSIYGFGEHNYTNKADFYKLTGHYTIGKGVSAYAQGTHFSQGEFDEQTALAGIGYTDLAGSNWTFKPFFGMNTVMGDDPNGEDATAMMGWTAYYNFGDGVSVSNWHESLLATDKADITAKGAVGLWYDLTQRVYIGAQYAYRYATGGADRYGDSVIMRVGVHL